MMRGHTPLVPKEDDFDSSFELLRRRVIKVGGVHRLRKRRSWPKSTRATTMRALCGRSWLLHPSRVEFGALCDLADVDAEFAKELQSATTHHSRCMWKPGPAGNR